MKYAAVFEIGGWMRKENKLYEGDSPEMIIRQLESYQDLDCLVMMGRENEDREGQKEVRKIADFLKKYRSGDLTLENIKDFTFDLSVGSFRCLDVAQGEADVEALKTKWSSKN